MTTGTSRIDRLVISAMLFDPRVLTPTGPSGHALLPARYAAVDVESSISCLHCSKLPGFDAILDDDVVGDGRRREDRNEISNHKIMSKTCRRPATVLRSLAKRQAS